MNRNDESQARAVALTHPTLGRLVGTNDALEGSISFRASRIVVMICPDGQPLESALALGEKVVNTMESVNERCCALIADESLGSYNSSWRIGDVVQSDGSTTRLERPELTEHEFRSRLVLKCVEITGSELASVWYECGDLFWGHSFNVTSFDGASFTDTRVELQG